MQLMAGSPVVYGNQNRKASKIYMQIDAQIALAGR